MDGSRDESVAVGGASAAEAARTTTGRAAPALPGPVLTIHLDRVEANTRALASRLPGVSLVGVVKTTCGSHEIGQAMLRGGAMALADSRLPNLAKLRAAGIRSPLWLLRAPAPAQAGDVVRLADVSLESEFATLRALDTAASAVGIVHRVIVMVELGDLREGIMPDELLPLVDQTVALEHIQILGVGTNLGCYGGIVPSRENLGRLVNLATEVRRRLGGPIVVSGGASSTVRWRWRAECLPASTTFASESR